MSDMPFLFCLAISGHTYGTARLRRIPKIYKFRLVRFEICVRDSCPDGPVLCLFTSGTMSEWILVPRLLQKFN